jgi:hypothetical protein
VYLFALSVYMHTLISMAGNTKGGSITVLLTTSCLTGLD